MASPLPLHRIELATALIGLGPKPFALRRERLRFCLGISAADLRVPFHLTPGAQHILTQSARQLAMTLASRHRGLATREEVEQLQMAEGYGALAAPESLFPTSGGPDLRATAELGLSAHPALTGGVMGSWLGPGGGGRSLVALTIALFERARAELLQSHGREETPVLVALMLSHALAQLEPSLRTLPLPPSIERSLRGATAMGVFLALRLGLERALRREGKLAPEILVRAEAPVLLPLALLGGIGGARSSGATVYGCELLAGVPGADEAISQLSTVGPSAAVRTLARALSFDQKNHQRAVAAGVASAIRPLLLRLARAAEGGVFGGELRALIFELLLRPGKLSALAQEDPAPRQELLRLLTPLELGHPEGQRVLGDLRTFLKGYSPREPEATLRLRPGAVAQRYAESALACVADAWIEREVRGARRQLVARTGAEAEGGLEDEYQQGRLYRLSEQQGPLLRSAIDPQLGHLFVDVKDFTRRTALLGQAAMADFLRREFYEPILRAARARNAGYEGLGDKGGISVNNLLGDALSLSGQIDRVVALALDIRRHLQALERRLMSELSREKVAEAVETLEREYAERLRNVPPWTTPDRIFEERERALARAKGEGLEAGLFISFGPAPLQIVVDDDVFGRSKVAIGERINESARGTARSNGARARADALLASAREARGDPALVQPFSVFIGAPFTLHLPPELEASARAAMRAKDVPAAMRALSGPMRQLIEELGRTPDGAAGEIYNCGAALSHDALVAYQEACGPTRIFRDLEVDPALLHPELHARFFLPPEPLQLVLGYSPERRLAEVFRYVGRALFKGLEAKGGVRVWELLDRPDFVALLERHHGEAWLGRASSP